MSCRPKNRESALRLVRILRLPSSASVSFKVRSGRSAFNANIRSACASNGETLPPRGFGAALRLSSQRCSHRTAELALTPICSAASRRDAPISTLSITRSRMSPEYDFGIASPRTRESMHADSLIRSSLGIPADSNRPGTALEDRWRAFRTAFEEACLAERVRLIQVVDPEEEFRVLIEDHIAEHIGSLDENMYADL